MPIRNLRREFQLQAMENLFYKLRKFWSGEVAWIAHSNNSEGY